MSNRRFHFSPLALYVTMTAAAIVCLCVAAGMAAAR